MASGIPRTLMKDSPYEYPFADILCRRAGRKRLEDPAGFLQQCPLLRVPSAVGAEIADLSSEIMYMHAQAIHRQGSYGASLPP